MGCCFGKAEPARPPIIRAFEEQDVSTTARQKTATQHSLPQSQSQEQADRESKPLQSMPSGLQSDPSNVFKPPEAANDNGYAIAGGESYEYPEANTKATSIQTNPSGPTLTIKHFQDEVLNGDQTTVKDDFVVEKELGKGGFGVVSLCRTKPSQAAHRRGTPQLFALKELISPTVFPLGQNAQIRDYLPLNEAAIQRYMKHSAIVETYWADVRYLDPKTNTPLDVGLTELDGAWTPLDHIEDMEVTATAPRPSMRYKEVKLQMRIAMEHCDLGSIKDYLVDNPEKHGTHSLVEMLNLKQNMNITIDPTLCALLTALDIAEALKFMHKSKTLHGDLKPHNILLVSETDDKGFRAKISDFGLSQHMTKEQNYVLVSKGTEAYLPVEVFQHLALTEKSDVYALGLVMWEIFYGIFWHAIYEKEKRRKGVTRPIQMGDYHPSCNSFCPSGFANIVHNCVRRDPKARPTAADIVTELNGVIASLNLPQTSTALSSSKQSLARSQRSASRR